MKKNAIYGQSGGVTSVINASAYGVIKACLGIPEIEKLFIGIRGIDGMLNEEFVDITLESKEEIERLPYTPGAIFGSCRTVLKTDEQFERLFRVFDAHDIGYLFYNGGNDSMDTVYKVSEKARELGYPLKAIGIPKTVDNDLMLTDHCPGYGSAAKFTATSMLEATMDLRSMYHASTRVFIMESMGRHAGWLAASGAAASLSTGVGPQIVLLPEVPFDEVRFLSKVEESLGRDGYCSIIASEALKDGEGDFISVTDYVDSFGNVQLGKIGNYLEILINRELGLKVHLSVPDYLQRSARHIASLTDWQEAIDVGATAVKLAAREELTGVMVSIARELDDPYLKLYTTADLGSIAGKTKTMPREYISDDGFGVTEEFLKYVTPLIRGEAPVCYVGGVPEYGRFKMNLVPKRLE